MQSLAVFSASALFADYIELEGYRTSAARLDPTTLGRGFSMTTFYDSEASLRIQCLAAAPFAPVAPRGEVQTFGEHGLLCAESGHTGATRRLVANR